MWGFSAGLGRWVEIGNSGMFRPEMLEPMGLPKDVTAIAWGLSLERYAHPSRLTHLLLLLNDQRFACIPHRPTMIKYGIDNIRELVGHKVDLGMVYRNPVCRLP